MKRRKGFLLPMLVLCFSLVFSSSALVYGNTSSSVLKVIKGTPNSHGNISELYLLTGSVKEGSVTIDDSLVKLPASQWKDGVNKALHIFHFNDLHGNLVKYSSKGDTHSFAQMTKIVKDAKSGYGKDDAVLFISAGDDHTGTSLDELLGTNATEFIQSVPYSVYSQAGLDFATTGNHEFDYRSEILNMAIKQDAKFPVIVSNVVDSQYNSAFYPAAVAVVNDIRVGVVGLVTTTAPMHTASDPTLDAISPDKTIASLIPALEPYVDCFVIISHVGYDGVGSRYTMDVGDLKLAGQLDKLTSTPSVIIGGHSHTVLNADGLDKANLVGKVPVVQTGNFGANLGEVTMKLSQKNKKISNDTLVALHPLLPGYSSNPDAKLESKEDYDAAIQGVINSLQEKVKEVLKQVIGKTENDPLISKEENAVRRYVGESPVANFVNDAIVKRSEQFSGGKVDFAIGNATSINGLPINTNVSLLDMYTLFPYADTVVVVELTGKQIKDIVENNAVRVLKQDDFVAFGGKIEADSAPDRGYMHFSKGIRYTINQGTTADKNTVSDLTLNGKKIDDVLEQKFKVAVNTYLANGRGCWNGDRISSELPEDLVGFDLKTICESQQGDTGFVYRKELIEYIKEIQTVGTKSGVVIDGRVTVK